MVFDYHERLRRLQILLASRCQLQQSIVLHVLLQIAGDERLAYNRTPKFLISTLTRTEQIMVLMLMGYDFFRLATDDKVFHIVGTEVLLNGHDNLQRENQLVSGFYLDLGMQAVVAVVAVVLVVDFTEIVEQHLPSANAGLGIGCRLLQQLTAYILFSNRLAFHKLVEFTQVLIGIKSQTDALPAVTTGTSRLLVIAFQRLGDVVVYDEAHIGFVDSHAKGYRSHDDIYLLHQEIILSLGTGSRVESCMVCQSFNLISTQYFSQFLYFLSRQTVDDATLAGMLFDELDNILVNILRLRPHLIIEIRTIER